MSARDNDRTRQQWQMVENVILSYREIENRERQRRAKWSEKPPEERFVEACLSTSRPTCPQCGKREFAECYDVVPKCFSERASGVRMPHLVCGNCQGKMVFCTCEGCAK